MLAVEVQFWDLQRKNLRFSCSQLKLYDQSDVSVSTLALFWQIPIFQRGGTVIPLKTAAGKSTEWMTNISYELRVALNTEVLWNNVPLTKLSFATFILKPKGASSRPLLFLLVGAPSSFPAFPQSETVRAQPGQNIFLTFLSPPQVLWKKKQQRIGRAQTSWTCR